MQVTKEQSSMATQTKKKDTNNYVMVLCCMCGVPMAPNAANTCASCLASTSDITRGISTEATLHQCRGCQRWHKEAGKWIACELESRELMSLCLSHVSGLRSSKNKNSSTQRVRLIDASWIWTEPHSMRLKVRLTVQRQVQTGTILQQSFTVVFIVRNQQCIECQAEFRQGSWKSLVQVRQRVSHKRTVLYLEQLILKHGAHRGCLSIQAFRDGIDFYFPDKSKAARFISFLENVCPVKIKMSKKLIGTDDKSNISNFKYTNLVEICPLCKDDVLFLPAKMARNMGNISRLVLVKNISNLIHLMDPLTGQTASMSPEVYWRDPIRPLITAARSRMTRYIVLGKEPVYLRKNVSKRSASRKQRTRLARLTLAREEDLGTNDVQYEEQSHIGYLLKSGDVCLGYDLKDTQFVDDEAEALRVAGKLPDMIVTRKLYGGVAHLAAGDDDNNDTTGTSSAPPPQRIWRLQRLDVDHSAIQNNNRGARNAATADDMDEEDFLQEVEADKEMRQNMNLYKTQLATSQKKNRMEEQEENNDDDEYEDDQEIKLDELLDGLELRAGPDDPTQAPAAATAATLGGNDAEGQQFPRAQGEKASQDGINYVAQEEARNIRDKDSAIPVTSGILSKELFDDL